MFAAQKLGVTLDACALGEAGSAFLEQGAHLTGDIYTKPCLPSQQFRSISVCTDLSSPQEMLCACLTHGLRRAAVLAVGLGPL
jgi:hypothetical protein